MLEHGALLVLSADGKMAVDLADPATVPSEEDTVTVTLSSGTQIEGTVEKVSDDGCTITMTDSGVGLGDTATVTDEKGNSIGTGTIYIHQPLQVTGTAGSISEVNFHLRTRADTPLLRTEYQTCNKHLLLTEKSG